jgi:hypothetical protein
LLLSTGVKPIGKLKRLDKRIALLAVLTVQGIKPVSKIDGFEGPDEAVAGLLREMGLEVEVEKSGCKTDILFGKKKAMGKYHKAESLKGKEKICEVGKVFGYPDCCSRFFAEFMMGEADGKPGKKQPLEHFICPGCKESPRLLKKYKKVEDTV